MCLSSLGFGYGGLNDDDGEEERAVEKKETLDPDSERSKIVRRIKVK